MQASSPDVSTTHDQIKELFLRFDTGRKGSMSKLDMKKLLLSVCEDKWSGSDLDACFEKADLNKNGLIEYDEFLRWVLLPTSLIHPVDSGVGVAYTDVEAMLKPLYSVYDRDGSQGISKEEFVEVHTILQGAKTIRDEEEETVSSSSMLDEHPNTIFKRLDTNRDGIISFEEFVEWQRGVLDGSGLSTEEVHILVAALARQLARVFKLADAANGVEQSEHDEAVLGHIIKNLASFSDSLWRKSNRELKSLFPATHYTNRWDKPPAGCSIQRLKAKFMASYKVTAQDMEIIVIPCHPDVESVIESLLPSGELDVAKKHGKSQRSWVAQVSTKYRTKKGADMTTDEFCYYTFHNLNWIPLEYEGSKPAFRTSWENLPPDLRVFAIMKSKACFGDVLTLDEMQQSLSRAIQEGILKEDDVTLYMGRIAMKVRAIHRDAVERGEIEHEVFSESSMQGVTLAPADVMIQLADQGVFRVSSAWADLVDT